MILTVLKAIAGAFSREEIRMDRALAARGKSLPN